MKRGLPKWTVRIRRKEPGVTRMRIPIRFWSTWGTRSAVKRHKTRRFTKDSRVGPIATPFHHLWKARGIWVSKFLLLFQFSLITAPFILSSFKPSSPFGFYPFCHSFIYLK